ncbi:MAG TPA: ferritin-like domain-containing protein, partial [Pseudonocardiaceae bacterium]|nr:ferritin-like domain-containing protein [Pseudonocardiaceae bacterium]
LLTALTTAQHQAAALMPTLPRYRAGLVGSVAAGCASLTEALNSKPITTTSATSANPAPSGGTPTLTGPTATSTPGAALPADTAAALQHALSAENAALWLYGTASAFVTAGPEAELDAAMQAVQNLRDATAARLTAGQVTPQPAQPAYLVPRPVTDQPSALAALAIAESDATVAWRSVLEHTDDRGLRAAALAALVDSAVRETRWRRLSGQSPASVAMPGEAA